MGADRRRRRLCGPGPRRQGRLRPPHPPRRAGAGPGHGRTTSSYLRADAVEILTPSPDRVAPPCPHAGPGRCGGCDFQHVDVGAQRRLKAFRIAEQLERLAGLDAGASRSSRSPVTRTGWAGAAGCGWRWTAGVRWASGATAPIGSNTSSECPIASPGRHRHRRPGPPLARRHRARGGDWLRSGRGRGLGHAASAGRAAPARHRHRPGGRREDPPPAGRRARLGRHAPLPDFTRRLLAGPQRAPRRRCSRRSWTWPATARGRRSSTSTPAPASSPSRWPRRWALRARSSPWSGTARACADARHNGADLPQPARPRG